jgi:hypothetical protein
MGDADGGGKAEFGISFSYLKIDSSSEKKEIKENSG